MNTPAIVPEPQPTECEIHLIVGRLTPFPSEEEIDQAYKIVPV